MIDHQLSRRLFLRNAGVLSAAGAAAAPLALNMAAIGSAAAQSAGDYKALVCIFLFGGNDSLNMVLSTDTANWLNYTNTRNQAPESIALLAPGTAPDSTKGVGSPARLGGVLPISPANANALNTGRTFALHPLMGTLQAMFDTDKRLAIVPNIGPLIRPTTKVQYGQASFPKPASLYSHNDQQNTWQALGSEGVTRGWGGRMGDALAGMNTRVAFTSVSAAGNAVWLSGQTVRQYQVSTNGAIRMGADANGRIYGSNTVADLVQRIARQSRGSHVLEADVAAVAQRSIDAEVVLRTALKPASDAAFGTPATNYNANTDPKLQYDNPLTGAKAFNAVAPEMPASIMRATIWNCCATALKAFAPVSGLSYCSFGSVLAL